MKLVTWYGDLTYVLFPGSLTVIPMSSASVAEVVMIGNSRLRNLQMKKGANEMFETRVKSTVKEEIGNIVLWNSIEIIDHSRPPIVEIHVSSVPYFISNVSSFR